MTIDISHLDLLPETDPIAENDLVGAGMMYCETLWSCLTYSSATYHPPT